MEYDSDNIRHMNKRTLIMTAILMAAFIFGGTTEISAQNKKVKELEEELKRLRDSIRIQNDEIEYLKE